MDKVRLQVYNKLTKETYIKSELYDREVITKWVDHQVKEMGAQFHIWTILELEEK